MSIARLVLHDTIRRSLPATVAGLMVATGASNPTIRRHLEQLTDRRCVARTWCPIRRQDVWTERPGATWAHLVGE